MAVISKEAAEEVRRLLPWASANGVGYTALDPRRAAEEGFEWIWGYCWNQVVVDGITDRGCPWGFFYVSPKSYKCPNPEEGGIVGLEWVARDLCNALHSGNPCIFSFDPDDVLGAGLCNANDISYWERLFDLYVANCYWNDHIFFVLHQEGHEMDWLVFPHLCSRPLTMERLKMLDKFLAHAKGRGVTFATIPEAVKVYKRLHKFTAPSFMLFDDVAPPVFSSGRGYPAVRKTGPYPRTFLYYDRECQLAFVEGKRLPVLVYDYTNQTPTTRGEPYPEERPRVEVALWRERRTERGEVEVDTILRSDAVIPYGICIWGDLGAMEPVSVENCEARTIGGNLIFVRLNLKKGENRVRLTLKRP